MDWQLASAVKSNGSRLQAAAYKGNATTPLQRWHGARIFFLTLAAL
jgi:hypothetical protein